MKFVGVDGSGRTGGNTGTLVRGFLGGAQEAGADTTLIELGDWSIRGCTACKSCKSDPRKVCIIQDDMQQFYRLAPETDVLFLGSPIYLDHITAQLMTFIQRTYCYLSPSLENYWPHQGTRFVAGITYGVGDSEAYNYVLDWMEARMKYYFDIPAAARLRAPACSHTSIIGADHPEVARARELGREMAAG
ncbi:MAG: flavodoxin family protein [Planctomycetota bacterium]